MNRGCATLPNALGELRCSPSALACSFAGLPKTATAATISTYLTADENGGTSSCTGSPTPLYEPESNRWYTNGSTGAESSMSCTDIGGTELLSQSTGITSLGASISATGQSGELDAGGGYTEVVTFSGTDSTLTCPAGNGVVECYGGGAPSDPQAGSPLQASLYFSVNGTVSGCFFEYGCVGDLTGQPNVLSASVAESTACSSSAAPGARCFLYTANGGETGTAVESSGFLFQADIPLTLDVGFGVAGACETHGCSADFSDPDLTDILITDPATGLPVLGLTATGDDGTIFPVDVGISETPEPSSLMLLATGLTGLGIAIRRKLCYSALN
jgi:hypothetical protein